MATRLFPGEARSLELEAWQREGSRAIAADVGAWSRKGAARLVNEDFYASATLSLSRGRVGGPLFLAVADGLGGEEAGERASRLATQSMVDRLCALPASRIEGGAEELLQDAFMAAHWEVVNDGKADFGRWGMATTLTAALVLWPRVHIIHAGDSRVYRLHRGNLRQLTLDHTVAEVLVARGQLSRVAARVSRYRHILWNHLGGEARLPEPQTASVDLEPGDGLLLATDGLTEAFRDSELAERVSRPCSAHAVCHMLIEEAQTRGTRDDATALFARFDPPAPS